MSFFDDVFDFLFGWMMPKADVATAIGSNVTKAATDEYIPLAYGAPGRCKGIVAWKATSDADGDDVPNDLLHLLIVWSYGPISEFGELYLDDEPISSDRFAAENGNRWAHVRHFKNGLQDYYDPQLAAAGFDFEQYKASGLAVSYVRLENTPDEGVWAGEPRDITCDIKKGFLCHNPVDNQRLAHDSPIVLLWELLTNAQLGYGLDESRVNKQSFIDAINRHSVQVPNYLNSEATRKKFVCNWQMPPRMGSRAT